MLFSLFGNFSGCPSSVSTAQPPPPYISTACDFPLDKGLICIILYEFDEFYDRNKAVTDSYAQKQTLKYAPEYKATLPMSHVVCDHLLHENFTTFPYFCLLFITFFENSTESPYVFSTTYRNNGLQMPA
jgi:hypothetical protein